MRCKVNDLNLCEILEIDKSHPPSKRTNSRQVSDDRQKYSATGDIVIADSNVTISNQNQRTMPNYQFTTL